MEVSVFIRRSDLIRFNWHLLPRARENRVTVLVVAACVFLYLLFTRRPDSAEAVLFALGASLIGGIGALLAGFVISLLFVLFVSSNKNGILGEHRYVITEAGLHESSEVNESLQKWVGIQAIGESGAYFYARVNGFLFYLVPKRAFASQGEASAFWNQMKSLWGQRQA